MKESAPGQRTFTYRDVEPFKPVEKELELYTGSYFCRELDKVYRIFPGAEGKLTLVIDPLPPEELEPIFRNGFLMHSGNLVFNRDSNEQIKGFRLSVGRARNFTFVKSPNR